MELIVFLSGVLATLRCILAFVVGLGSIVMSLLATSTITLLGYPGYVGKWVIMVITGLGLVIICQGLWAITKVLDDKITELWKGDKG